MPPKADISAPGAGIYEYTPESTATSFTMAWCYEYVKDEFIEISEDGTASQIQDACRISNITVELFTVRLSANE